MEKREFIIKNEDGSETIGHRITCLFILPTDERQAWVDLAADAERPLVPYLFDVLREAMTPKVEALNADRAGFEARQAERATKTSKSTSKTATAGMSPEERKAARLEAAKVAARKKLEAAEARAAALKEAAQKRIADLEAGILPEPKPRPKKVAPPKADEAIEA